MAENLGFTYTLKRGSVLGGLKIAIRPDGEVVVTAPKLLPVAIVEQELRTKADWVKKCLAKTAARQKNTQTGVEIFGRQYHKVVGNWPGEKVGVRILTEDNGRLIIRVNSPTLSSEKAEEKITDFLKLTAEKYIRRRVPQLAEQMGLTGHFRRISLKKQMTRWGSCSSDKNLNFNWTLVYYPPEVIDYVIIHELAHLREMNHSPAFWAIVAKYDPSYKKHKKVLNG